MDRAGFDARFLVRSMAASSDSPVSRSRSHLDDGVDVVLGVAPMPARQPGGRWEAVALFPRAQHGDADAGLFGDGPDGQIR